jgi:uncharacterized protein YggU (UPF0235/DUF167 family)
MVAVTAPPVDGRANDAVCRAVAKAFGLAVSDVTLVTGSRSRTKVLDLAADVARIESRLQELLSA